MRAIKRKAEIYNIILKNGTAEVNELAAIFDCSSQTIRRDLQDLAQQNLVKVYYGGASLLNKDSVELSYAYKETQQLQFKEIISQKAATLLEDGMVVSIDAGTTTAALFRYICHLKITIITNNLPPLMAVDEKTRAKIIVVGGHYDAISAGCIGSLSSEYYKSFNADYAFLTTMAIDAQGKLSVAREEDAAVKIAIFNNAKKRILLVDENKFDLSFIHKYQAIEEYDLVVSNQEQRPDFLAKFSVDYK